MIQHYPRLLHRIALADSDGLAFQSLGVIGGADQNAKFFSQWGGRSLGIILTRNYNLKFTYYQSISGNW